MLMLRKENIMPKEASYLVIYKDKVQVETRGTIYGTRKTAEYQVKKPSDINKAVKQLFKEYPQAIKPVNRQAINVWKLDKDKVEINVDKYL